MDKKLMLIADLVDCINSAIKAGDWKVDGPCDPDSILKRARLMIEKNESGENIILTKDNIEVGKKYKWKCGNERLIYIGKAPDWYQFVLEEKPNKLWCEVHDEDLHMLEEI